VEPDGGERAVSPVVGGILLIGILVALVTVAGVMIFGATDDPEPSPDVAFELRETDDRYRYAFLHRSGDRLDGDRVELRRVADPDSPAGSAITAVQNGGIVVGDVDSGLKEFDGDDAKVYGEVDVEKVANLQDGTIAGDTTSRTADVKAGNATIGGSVEAEKVAELADGSVAEGDVESRTKDAKVLDSEVEGSVTADGIVKLQDATVDGHVYVNASDFDCTNSTVNGADCGSYTPKDPSNW